LLFATPSEGDQDKGPSGSESGEARLPSGHDFTFRSTHRAQARALEAVHRAARGL